MKREVLYLLFFNILTFDVEVHIWSGVSSGNREKEMKFLKSNMPNNTKLFFGSVDSMDLALYIQQHIKKMIKNYIILIRD